LVTPAPDDAAEGTAARETAAQDNLENSARRPAIILSVVLLLAGVLIGLGSVVGVVSTSDGSVTTASTLAAFAALLPGLLALLLTLRRPGLGLAAAAGGGVFGIVRLFADLTVLADTDGVTRPELFVETTDRARPFTAAGGVWLLIAADVLMVVVGVLAAIRLADLVGSNVEPGPDDLFGRRDRAGGEADYLGDPLIPAAETDGGVVGVLSRPPPGRLGFNLPMLAAGFLGAVLLMVGALDIPYAGGYLGLPLVPIGSSLTGVVAAALSVLVAAVVVVIAAALPRAIAQALLAGTALAAAVPAITAVVAVLSGAPTNLAASAWWTLAGAAVLALSGLLARGRVRVTRSDVDGGEPPAGWLNAGVGLLGLLSAASLAVASQTSLLFIDGAAPDEIAGAVLAPTALPLLIAAIPLAIAGILALASPVAELGRTAAAVVWAGPIYALGQALMVRSRVLESARNPLVAELGDEYQHTWSAGPGFWLALIGTLLAVASAVLAVVTSRRIGESSLDVTDDATLDDSRATRRWPALGLALLTVVALALPVYSYLGRAASSTLLVGYDLGTWGVWAIAVATCGALWAAASTARPGVAATLLVAAAAVVVQPLILPTAIRVLPGFGVDFGFWVGIVVVTALLIAAPYFWITAGRVRLLDRRPLEAAPPVGQQSQVETLASVESKGTVR
jgi:hypothetical protein